MRLLRTFTALALLATPLRSHAVDPGDRAPEFALQDLGGREVRSAVGRPVVLNFWATWCGPCMAELPLLDGLQRALGDAASVLTVNLDSSARRPELVVRKLGLTLPVLRDDGTVAARYAPAAMPTTYVIDADGSVVAVHAGALSPEQLDALLGQVRGLAGGPGASDGAAAAFDPAQ